MLENTLLEVKGLKTYFYLDEGVLKAVDGIDFAIQKGRTLGLVGESGCGKSVTSQAILNIVPKPGKIEGEVLLYKDGSDKPLDLAKLDPFGPQIRSIRGAEIAMIFQEPMKAFHPMYTIGNQIMEALLLHVTDNEAEARDIALDMLGRVGMPNPKQRIDEYPHQLSGGMRQRAMIAMALCCRPSILIADEPTTALDVTVQAQVLQLIKELQDELGMAVIFITHDLGVIAEMADEVAVMYLGKIVEQCDINTIFDEPLHPYTKALLSSIPEIGRPARSKLNVIEGTVPIPLNIGKGCGFYSRCKDAKEGLCNTEDPPMTEVKPGHYVRCFPNE
ncbi:ABC transporter ATP-binding protein [Mahella australiensis]|uniref:Oligopeptide/dipeptide ABC transporter, ATPase subunit n=1 Tax=Mahella australiensis (strain DSM 15567 / CIP 107919 / 50-1 BON) TaxID=697281 RepID=F3ZW17_MAHA5|nr:ABC transporter ATP-binding protein [Mahella australiensis]AEE96397.1 oligopeptide/dipeptide ABC transporter, ATPase subunit [Mahella australiensis 50-1 BON]